MAYLQGSAARKELQNMKNAVCLNSNTHHGFTLAEAVAGARAAGIGYIELAAVRGYTEHARHEMTDEEMAGVIDLLGI